MNSMPHFDGRALINGQRVHAVSADTFTCISPVHGQGIAQVARCDAADVELAVHWASLAFKKGTWSNSTPTHRKKVLLRWADLVVAHADELALIETWDMGKPIQYARHLDVELVVDCLRWYAEAVDKIYGEVAPTGPDALGLITREPLGVVAAVVPWNYPLLIAAWKLAPALAAGNSVILKPSEKSPLSAMRFAELALEAGLPPETIHVLPGFGPEVGSPLALHMNVDAIAFTGSTRVGKQIHAMAAQSNLKRAWTELGGKSANLVFADCPDLERAADAAASAVFFNQGESCNALSRLLVEASIKDRFMELLLQRVEAYLPGDPLSPETEVGALIDDAHLDAVQRMVRSGQEEGARLLCGGHATRTDTGGFYHAPTIFDRVGPDMRIAREEIFGPVLSVMSFEGDAEAVELANATEFGLQAAVWTRQLDRAFTVARALRVGTVHINQYDEDDMTSPFGGIRQSGNGRDRSLHALDKYTELKSTWVRIGTPQS